MAEISQLAANAINSLENVGGEQLQSFAETITNLTTMMAVGELTSMLQDLGAFEDALPNR